MLSHPHAQTLNNVFYVNLGGRSNTKSTVQRIKDGVKTTVTNTVNGAFEANRDYKIKVVVSQNNMTVFVDGELMFNYTQNDAADCPLNYVAQKDNTTGDIIIKAVNTSDNDCTVNINILGATDIGKEARATILTSASKYDENSFDNPENVAPVTVLVTNVSDNFEYTFMRNSVTVLVIPTGDKTANKTELKKAVDFEEATPPEGSFTAKTLTAYRNALADAKTVLNNADATQKEVNVALENLLGTKALLTAEFKDINRDGYVTVGDALELVYIVIDNKVGYNFDFNDDGQCNLLDVLVVIKSIVL